MDIATVLMLLAFLGLALNSTGDRKVDEPSLSVLLALVLGGLVVALVIGIAIFTGVWLLSLVLVGWIALCVARYRYDQEQHAAIWLLRFCWFPATIFGLALGQGSEVIDARADLSVQAWLGMLGGWAVGWPGWAEPALAKYRIRTGETLPADFLLRPVLPWVVVSTSLAVGGIAVLLGRPLSEAVLVAAAMAAVGCATWIASFLSSTREPET